MSFPSNQSRGITTVQERVVDAVADANGVDPTALEPLYHTIDPEALDGLFKPGVDGSVTFTYEGHEVVVHSDGGATVDGSLVAVTPSSTVVLGEDESGASAAGQ